MSNIDKNLQKIFDLPKGELIIQGEPIDLPETETLEQNAEFDYEKARNNIHVLIQQGSDALQYALEIAKESEHPKAFEVFNQILKNVADMNLQLMETSEKYKSIAGKKVGKTDSDGKVQENPPQITNNTIAFVGTNSELNKMIDIMLEQRKNEKDIE